MSGAAPVVPTLDGICTLLSGARALDGPLGTTLELCILTLCQPWQAVAIDLERIDWERGTVEVSARGYSPEIVGDHGLRIMFDGVCATVLFYGDATLSLVCSVRGDGIARNLDDVNEANNRVRFVKFSVDPRGNLQLRADFVHPLAGPDATDQLKHLLALWRQALHELKALVERLLPA